MDENETEARSIGWVPKEEFRGAEDRWVDAETFLERGRTVLPIVKQQNDRLRGDVVALRGQVEAVTATLKATEATIRALEESRDEDVKERVKEAREGLLAQLKAAKKEGDTDLEVDLTDQLTQLNAADRTAQTREAGKQQLDAGEGKQAPAIDPAFLAWQSQNPWFGTDLPRTHLAIGVARQWRQEGNKEAGDVFMNKVKDEVNRLMKGEVPGHKVEEGARHSSSGGGDDRAKTYADLPPEAKAVCDKQVSKLVGPNRAHKDVASWRNSYARQFFAS